jgi:hypothetical protein
LVKTVFGDAIVGLMVAREPNQPRLERPSRDPCKVLRELRRPRPAPAPRRAVEALRTALSA